MYVFSESNAPRPEFTVMISMPFEAAVLSGSLSALASGTDVAITFTFAAIAALIPETCFETSLFAYTCVTVTPRAFRSLAAWSTPFLNTDQNEPVSPWVTTPTFTGVAVAAPNAVAAAGPPMTAAPAVSSPPFTISPRLVTFCSPSVSSSSFSDIYYSFLDGIAPDRFTPRSSPFRLPPAGSRGCGARRRSGPHPRAARPRGAHCPARGHTSRHSRIARARRPLHRLRRRRRRAVGRDPPAPPRRARAHLSAVARRRPRGRP